MAKKGIPSLLLPPWEGREAAKDSKRFSFQTGRSGSQEKTQGHTGAGAKPHGGTKGCGGIPRGHGGHGGPHDIFPSQAGGEYEEAALPLL